MTGVCVWFETRLGPMARSLVAPGAVAIAAPASGSASRRFSPREHALAATKHVQQRSAAGRPAAPAARRQSRCRGRNILNKHLNEHLEEGDISLTKEIPIDKKYARDE
jgi:hypothetical protein